MAGPSGSSVVLAPLSWTRVALQNNDWKALIIVGSGASIVAGILAKTCFDGLRMLRVMRATFGKDARLAAEPLPSRKERDEKLKRGPKLLQPFLDNPPDAIVVGSGIGGLTCAAILGRAGKRVLVLEQHDVAGGCCHTYAASGYEWDVGIHYVGEVGGPTPIKAVLDQITRGQLQWGAQQHYDTAYVPVSRSAGLKQEWDTFPMSEGREGNEAQLCKRFPSEAAGIRAFFRDVQLQEAGALLMITKILPSWLLKCVMPVVNLLNPIYTRLGTSLTEALNKHGIKDSQVRAVLSYCWGDLGNIPASMSYGIQCGLHAHFMRFGAFFPIGGAGYIPYFIAETIRAQGGDVLVRCPVDEILLDGAGRVSGVSLGSGKRQRIMLAPNGQVVAATNLTVLYEQMLRSAPIRTPVCLQPGGYMREGMAAMSLFVGLENSGEEIGIASIKDNAWAFLDPDMDSSFEHFMALTRDEVVAGKLPLPGVFVGFPSSKDPSFAAAFPGKASVTVVTFVNWAWFEQHKDERVHKRSEGYKALKDCIAEQMWDFTCKVYPQLRKAKIGHFEAGSPLSNNYYIGTSKGEIYGADHSFRRFSAENICAQRPDAVGIPGLVIGGQENICGGFAGGLYGGVLAAGEVLGSHLGVWAGIVSAGFRFVPGFKL